jgi:hypothetical protein
MAVMLPRKGKEGLLFVAKKKQKSVIAGFALRDTG